MGRPLHALALVMIIAGATPASGQEQHAVPSPTNIELSRGAEALRAGDAETGLNLTLAGLKHTTSRNERVTGLSNACAAYILLQKYETALEYCNEAVATDDRYWRARANRALIAVLQGRYAPAEEDLDRAEAVAPDAGSVRAVRGLLRDKVNPVTPAVIIDDRGGGGDNQ